MLKGKKVIALIQARCTSTRLPKKHFRYIGDKMLMDWVVDRLKNVNEIDEIIISATCDISDVSLKTYAEKKKIGFYGYDGDINDVVGRHYNAVKNKNADYIVVISGDCPLIHEKFIKEQLYTLEQGYFYTRPSTVCVHEGIDSYSMDCVEFLNDNSKTPYERENYGVIIRENLNLVKVGFIELDKKYTENIFRISVDNMADLRFMNEVYYKLKNENKDFNIDNVLELAGKDRDLLDINSHVEQKKKGEKTYKFLIKTEASEEKGLGHLKRMIVFGQYLNENKNNGVVYVINKDKTAKSILENEGYIYDYSYGETEEELIELISNYKSDILIIDVQKLEGNTGYNFKNIKDKTNIKRIILIDKYISDDSIDLMIIQGIQSDEFEEEVKGDDRVLYGLECVFINKDFVKAKKIRRKMKKYGQEKEIAICFGGSDLKDLTIKTIKELNSVNLDFKAKFKIILGPYYRNFDKFKKELVNFKYKYEIVKEPINYADELIHCDYGIIAYGVSFYEFLYMGIPTVNYAFNQEDFKILRKIENMNLGVIKDRIDLDFNSLNGIEFINFSMVGDLQYIYRRISW
ncbi:cytidylyltransferase domain-containing protein [Clostridium sp.]|uniref:cytidylyltransferase domain-containing protein n=1 Tax=Clostridium sp. TaxID=1506 RepID=UPI002FDE52C9